MIEWGIILIFAVIGLSVLFLLFFIVVLPIRYYLKKRQENAQERNYLKHLSQEDRRLLSAGSHPLDPPLNLYIDQESGTEPIIQDDENYLPLLEELGHYKLRFRERQDFEYRLLGEMGKLRWFTESHGTLPWVKKVLDIWDRIKEIRDKIHQDPLYLFQSDFWPEHGYHAIRLFLDQDKKSLIQDEDLSLAFHPVSTRFRVPAAMLLRPVNQFWTAEEAWQILPDLPIALYPQAFAHIPLSTIQRDVIQLWTRILNLPYGSPKQLFLLRWLQDHPDLILRNQLLQPSLFTQEETLESALALAMLHPDARTLTFLEEIPRTPEIYTAITQLTEKLKKTTGYLSESSEEQSAGTISTVEEEV